MPAIGLFKTLLIAALLLSGAASAASTITIAAEGGKTVAQFTVGDSNCVLKDDEILCTPKAK
jgi:hypothetical protein